MLILFPLSPSQFKEATLPEMCEQNSLVSLSWPNNASSLLASFTVSCSNDCSSAQSNDRPHSQTNHCRHQPCANLQSRRSSDRYPVRLASKPQICWALQSFGTQSPGRWLGGATTDSFEMHRHAPPNDDDIGAVLLHTL